MRSHLVRPGLCCLGLSLIACSSDAGTSSEVASGPDAAIPDIPSLPDITAVDAGAVPAPLDALVPVAPGCPSGSEGCPCSASTVRTSTALAADDCQPGLVCANWDDYGRARGIPADILPEGSLQTCLRTCDRDADCSEGRSCTATRLVGSLLGPGVCVDDLVGVDEGCSLSRLGPDDVPDGIRPTTVARTRGCQSGLTCYAGLLGPDPEPVRPDQGFCGRECASDAQCAETPDTPVCQPDVFSNGSGFCAPSLDRPGSTCGTIDGRENPVDAFVLGECGSPSDNLVCIGLSNQIEDEGTLGVCVELCNDSVPCTFDDDDLGLQQCDLIPEDPNLGFCVSGCADSLTDACASGTCRTFVVDDVDVSVCAPSLEPVLEPATVDEFGLVATLGDDCDDELGFLRCPEDYVCMDGGPNPSLCLQECDPLSGADDAYCAESLGSGSACVSLGSGRGACSTPDP